jgi:hypothetical protein
MIEMKLIKLLQVAFQVLEFFAYNKHGRTLDEERPFICNQL